MKSLRAMVSTINIAAPQCEQTNVGAFSATGELAVTPIGLSTAGAIKLDGAKSARTCASLLRRLVLHNKP